MGPLKERGPKVMATAESPTKKMVIGAVCTWGFEACCGHQLEFLKISKQTSGAQMSYAQILGNIVRSKGVVGLWDGFLPWGTIQAIAKGSVFALAHAATKNALQPYTQKHGGWLSDKTAEVLAGGAGGGFQGLVLSPTLLLKTRVMTDPVFREPMGLLETTRRSCAVGLRVAQAEGARSLMKGSVVFSAKRVADWMSRYYFAGIAGGAMFGRCTDGAEKRKLTTSEQVAASLVGGTASALCTIPLDVLVAQIQQASNAGKAVGVFATLRTQVAGEGGVRRLFEFATRGFVARTAHVALTTALMQTATSKVYDLVCRDSPLA